MKTLTALFLAGAFGAASSLHLAAGDSGVADPAARLLREASLMLLKEGNARFVSGKSQHPNLDPERRAHTGANGQEPFATILACSDSREPVELLFDRGIGDLFVVRVAGNIADTSELATIEYGIGHLNTPLLVVLGHTKCGAVTAVVKGAKLHGHLPHLAAKIKPAAAKAKEETSNPDELVPKAIQANVWHTISEILTRSTEVRDKVTAGKAQVIGALYDLETGKVNWLGIHPGQEALLSQVIGVPGHGESSDSLIHAPRGNVPGHVALPLPANAPPGKARPAKPPAH